MILSYEAETCTEPAEGQLVSVSGTSLSAQFTYDGDGKRVKSIINNVTTYFVGNYYEVSGSTVKKNYYAGTQRVAMRTNNTLSYILSDHLGSTSIITDQDGENPIYQRYKAWGEVRYSSGALPTRYQYTGQYSYTPEFGLYFYNSRWYDLALGRFAQADSIVPEGVQGWDRYAYVNNNPIRFSDPSGHSIDCGIGEQYCKAGKIDVKTRAQELALNNKNEESSRNSRIYWDSLSRQDQSILSEGGFDPGAYNDFLDTQTRNVALLEDPAFYLSIAVSSGMKIALSLIAGACINGSCNNQAQVLGSTSSWPAPWSGPQTVNGITYSTHALQRMAPVGLGGRGVPPSAVENALNFGTSVQGKEPGISVITFENVRVVWNYIEKIVVTVIKLSH